ncbi:hypothetical protein ACFX13_033910 [Malus domestica]
MLHYATLLSPFDDLGLVDSMWVMGCTARVWLQAEMDEESKLRFAADNNSEITRGFYSCLVSVLDYALPDEVLRVKTDVLLSLNISLGNDQTVFIILFNKNKDETRNRSQPKEEEPVALSCMSEF